MNFSSILFLYSLKLHQSWFWLALSRSNVQNKRRQTFWMCIFVKVNVTALLLTRSNCIINKYKKNCIKDYAIMVNISIQHQIGLNWIEFGFVSVSISHFSFGRVIVINLYYTHRAACTIECSHCVLFTCFEIDNNNSQLLKFAMTFKNSNG